MKISKKKVCKNGFLMAGTSVGYTDYREGRSRMKIEDDMVDELIAEDKPVVMDCMEAISAKENMKVWVKERPKEDDQQDTYIKSQLLKLADYARKAFSKDGEDYRRMEKLEIAERERTATLQYLQTKKMMEVCSHFTKPDLIWMLNFIKTTCPECEDMSEGKAFVNFVANFIERFVNFSHLSTSHKNQCQAIPLKILPKNIEYFFHLNLTDIFADPATDSPKLKPHPDFDLKQKLKEMNMSHIVDTLSRLDFCGSTKSRFIHEYSCQKNLFPEIQTLMTGDQIDYLVTCIRKELGMKEDAFDLVNMGVKYVKSDTEKALEYLERGYKLCFEMHRNGEVLRETNISRTFLVRVKVRMIKHCLEDTKAYSAVQELFDLITEGQFKGLHVENESTLNDYSKIISLYAHKKMVCDKLDPICTFDLFNLGVRKLEKHINIKHNKTVNFHELMAVRRFKLMECLWNYHKWGDHGENWQEEVLLLEASRTIIADLENANIIVDLSIPKHCMTDRKQFVVETLDKALRIAKDNDLIFLNKGIYESSHKESNGKTCYEINKNVTIVGSAVHDVNIISSFVKYGNTTITLRRLTVCASEYMKSPNTAYKPQPVEGCYILEGVVNFENVKFPIDKDTAIFVIHSEGKTRPEVNFKLCTVSSLIKNLHQNLAIEELQERRFISFSGEAPKITMDTCLVKEICNAIGVLDTDIAPKKRENEKGEEVEVPNCAEIIIKDCQFLDILTVMVHEQYTKVPSEMKVTFRRNMIQCQSKDFELNHMDKFKKIDSKFLSGDDDYLSYTSRPSRVINIYDAKEVVMRGNLIQSRTYRPLIVFIGSAEKFKFESNYVYNEGCWEVHHDQTSVCLHLADVKEGLIRNNQIEGFIQAIKIDVRDDKYSYFGILDTDIEYCKVGITIQKPKLLELPTQVYDGHLRHPMRAALRPASKGLAKITISNIDFQINIIGISMYNAEYSVDISDCTFTKSCTTPILSQKEMVKKSLVRVNNRDYAYDGERFQKLIKENLVLVDIRHCRRTEDNIQKHVKKNLYYFQRLIFLNYMIIARRDKYQVNLKTVMLYSSKEANSIDPLEPFHNQGLEKEQILIKKDEDKVNGNRVLFDGNTDDEVD